MTQRFSAFFIVFVVVLLLFSPFFLVPVHAQDILTDPNPSGIVPCGDDGNKCTFDHLVCLANNVLKSIAYIATFVAILLFVYAGFLYISATGNTEQISKATSIFGNVLIGFILVLVAWLVIDTTLKVFTPAGLSNFGPWNQIQCGASGSSSNRTGSSGNQTGTNTTGTFNSVNSATRDGASSGVLLAGSSIDGISTASVSGALPANQNVYFDFDESTVKTEFQAVVNEHADYLLQNPDAQLVLLGHTDEVGTNNYNLNLGGERANAVRDALIARGISPDRIGMRSLGENDPVNPNTGENVWNRRVEFNYLGVENPPIAPSFVADPSDNMAIALSDMQSHLPANSIVVTRGSEWSNGPVEYGYVAGNQVDLEKNPLIDAYVKSLPNTGATVLDTPDGTTYSVPNSDGSTTKIIDNGDGWTVQTLSDLYTAEQAETDKFVTDILGDSNTSQSDGSLDSNRYTPEELNVFKSGLDFGNKLRAVSSDLNAVAELQVLIALDKEVHDTPAAGFTSIDEAMTHAVDEVYSTAVEIEEYAANMTEEESLVFAVGIENGYKSITDELRGGIVGPTIPGTQDRPPPVLPGQDVPSSGTADTGEHEDLDFEDPYEVSI